MAELSVIGERNCRQVSRFPCIIITDRGSPDKIFPRINHNFESQLNSRDDAMSNDLRKQIYNNLSQRETNDLVKIWKTNDQIEWTNDAFEVIRDILAERIGEVPAQNEAVREHVTEIRDDEFYNDKNPEEFSNQENASGFYMPGDSAEIIFTPKYPSRYVSGSFLLITIECLVVLQVLSGQTKSPEMVWVALLFGLVIILIPMFTIKQITFSATHFAVQKYLLPAKIFEYSDVKDIGTTMILTQKGIIHIESMINAGELKAILDKKIKQGKINKYQIENKIIPDEKLAQKALVPSLFLAVLFFGATFFIWPPSKPIFGDFSFLIIWIPTYFLVYSFLKKRTDNL